VPFARFPVPGRRARDREDNAPKNIFRGPGINNFDISLFKNFHLAESLRGQFRLEAYNAFNHTQFSSVNTNAQFDPATGAQTNLAFRTA
jgi:hypothetical protein